MDLDYKTLKEELKKELRQEMIAEFRELAKQEIHTLIFKEQYFEPALRTYIKSLCYEEIHYLRMLNKGVVKHGQTLIEIPKTTSGHLFVEINPDINIAELYKQYIKSGMMECSSEDFEAAINFNSICGYINWKQKAGSSFTYTGIFDLYSDILREDIYSFYNLQQDRFLYFIANKFLLSGKIIEYKKIRKAFLKRKKIKKQNE